MDLRFTPKQEAFRIEAREFITRKLPKDWVRTQWRYVFDLYGHSDEALAVARTMSIELGNKGWLSIPWPKEYGGRQGSYIDQLILAEELIAQHCPGLEIFACMIAPVLLEFGTEEQKKQHLAGIASGASYWCECLSEPNAGSDLASLQTSAREKDDHYVLNGQKVWTSAAHIADWSYVLARTDPDLPKHRGLSVFLVDMKTPGVSVRPLINATGDHEFNEVFFDDVLLPKESLLGGKNNGWSVTMRMLDFERAIAIPMYAEARSYLGELIEYARQTGSLNPTLRCRVSWLLSECEVAQLFIYRAASMADKGLNFSIEAAMAKVYSLELNQRVAALGMEIVGPYSGLVEGSKWAAMGGRAPWRYLRSLGNSLEMGSSEVDRIIIAQRGLRLPRG